MSNTLHEIPYKNQDGSTTWFYLQEIKKGDAVPTYVLHEHPKNAHSTAPSVRDISPKIGDTLIAHHRDEPARKDEFGRDREFKPEDLQLYAQRRDNEQFQKVEAKTTLVSNQKVGAHETKTVPQEWRYSEPHTGQYSRDELQKRFDVQVPESEYALRQKQGLEGVTGPQIDRAAEQQRIQEQQKQQQQTH